MDQMCSWAHRMCAVSSFEGQKLQSGLLDILVEHIARTVASSAVFVTAEVPERGVSLLAEFPPAGATSAPGTPVYEHGADGKYEGWWMDKPAVAAPVQFDNAVVGWAVMVGPTLPHDENAEGLINLLARCASVLLSSPQRDENAEAPRRRW